MATITSTSNRIRRAYKSFNSDSGNTTTLIQH